MHVCFLMPPFEIYAPERGLALAIIAYELGTELRSRGIETTVVTPSDGGPLYHGGRVLALDFDPTRPRRTLPSRVGRKVMGWDVPGYDLYLRSCRHALQELPTTPDVLIVFNDLVSGGRLARSGTVTLSWMQNEVRTNHRLGLRSLGKTDGVLAVSSNIAERCSPMYGPSAPPIHVLPNAVNAERFSPATHPERSGAIRSCFVGRIDPNKGPLLAAQAVERAQARGLDLTIDVAGPVQAWGLDEASTDRYVAALTETLDRTGGRWVGHVSREELPAFYRDHDIAFVPSVSAEPFGLVALEAMASGCAVIASNRGGLPEVCGSAAKLIDPESPDEFDAAIEVLARSPGRLAEARRRARSHAESRTWARSADRLLDIVAALR